jgi:thiamine pyrophosphate-dependent acetolactate synthase large subunit-like protein
VSSKPFAEGFATEGIPIHPGRCAAEVARFLEAEGRDWTLISDRGEASVWMGGAATAYRPHQILGTGANGTIGTGPGLAVGAWAAIKRAVANGKASIVNVEVDQVSLSPFIAGYAKALQPSE